MSVGVHYSKWGARWKQPTDRGSRATTQVGKIETGSVFQVDLMLSELRSLGKICTVTYRPRVERVAGQDDKSQL